MHEININLSQRDLSCIFTWREMKLDTFNFLHASYLQLHNSLRDVHGKNVMKRKNPGKYGNRHCGLRRSTRIWTTN